MLILLKKIAARICVIDNIRQQILCNSKLILEGTSFTNSSLHANTIVGKTYGHTTAPIPQCGTPPSNGRDSGFNWHVQAELDANIYEHSRHCTSLNMQTISLRRFQNVNFSTKHTISGSTSYAHGLTPFPRVIAATYTSASGQPSLLTSHPSG